MSDFPEVKDHLVANPDKYTMTTNPDGTVTLRPTWVDNPSEVLQEGTPVNAAFLQKIPEAIDAIDTKVTSQLADTAKKADLTDVANAIMFNGDYGRFEELPSDFPITLPFSLYRDKADNVVKHDLDFDSFEAGAGHVYISRYTGADANNGLTPSTPKRFVPDAFTLANTLAQDTVVIHLLDETADHSIFNNVFTQTLQKNIVIKSDHTKGTILFAGLRPNVASSPWEAFEGIYKKVYALGPVTLYDYDQQDDKGLPLMMVKVDSVAAVKAAVNTWYYDTATSSLYVRRVGDAALTTLDDAITYLHTVSSGYYPSFSLNNKRLVLRNVHFFFTASASAVVATSTAANTDSKLYVKDCSFAHSSGANGLAATGIRNTYVFDSFAYRNWRDGFNYHANAITADVADLAFEYNCEAFDNGNQSGNTLGTCNATTVHDGMYALRIGSKGYNCGGPILADVNGCYSVNIDCDMRDSQRPTSNTRAAYYFDNSVAVKQGKAVLINCKGGGAETYSINSDKTIPIFLRRFTGRNIPADNVLKPY